MKKLMQVFFLVCLVVLMLGAASGQTSVIANAADLSGRWVGTFDTVRKAGAVEPDRALLLLKQNGKTLTGTAGPSEEHMGTVGDGEVNGDDVRFAVTLGNVTVKFALRMDGDHLRGEASGLPGLEPEAKVLVNVVRWPDGAPEPQVEHVKEAPGASGAGLTATVTALDKKLFDAYNKCDLATMSGMVEDGLEFYHDQTGLMVGKQPFLDAIKQNICGKTQRELVSMTVYPLKGYGAVEVGVHRFTHPGEPGINEGEAKFVTLWENKNGTWMLARAISFDHGTVKP